MDTKTAKQIDSLYRNTKQMPTLALLGILIPILLLFGAPLGIVYAVQRSRLLKRIDSGEIKVSNIPVLKDNIPVADKIEYLRRHSTALLSPTIVVGIVVLAIAALLMFDPL